MSVEEEVVAGIGAEPPGPTAEGSTAPPRQPTQAAQLGGAVPRGPVEPAGPGTRRGIAGACGSAGERAACCGDRGAETPRLL